ncbi:hypothetical protein [Cyanobacterium sp. uoEpiScrs1]|nr:hypothetical protein [Cyanobacterium sp. uoEpiScrs1]
MVLLELYPNRKAVSTLRIAFNSSAKAATVAYHELRELNALGVFP